MHASIIQVASIIHSTEEGFQRTEKLLQQLGKGRGLGETSPSRPLAGRLALIKERKVMHCALSHPLMMQHQQCPFSC